MDRRDVLLRVLSAGRAATAGADHGAAGRAEGAADDPARAPSTRTARGAAGPAGGASDSPARAAAALTDLALSAAEPNPPPPLPVQRAFSPAGWPRAPRHPAGAAGPAGATPPTEEPYPTTRRGLRLELAPPADAAPLTVAQVHHLLRRAGFGPTPEDVPALTAFTATEAAAFLLDDRQRMPVAPPRGAEEWLNRAPYVGNDSGQVEQQAHLYERARYATAAHWVTLAHAPDARLRERMVLFWLNHFVIVADKVFFPQLVYRYLDAFRRNPWGNFRQMVKDVTVSGAMLIFLDGAGSRAEDPNENYARELLELFTLGVTDRAGAFNYTEEDIHQLARALAGWSVWVEAPGPDVLPVQYRAADHDGPPTTPFGAPPANYGLAAGGGPVLDVIDLLFERKGAQIAWFLCEKLYRFFVYPRTDGPVEQAVIEQLAQTLQASGWEIRPVLEQLLASPHFYDPANAGVMIKSPLDYLLGLMHAVNVPLDSEGVAGSVYYLAWFQGQRLLYPPNVRGWVGHRHWLSTTTLALRNVIVAPNLVIGGQLGDTVDDGNGNTLEPLLLSHETLLAWARGLDSFSGDFGEFFTAMSDALLTHAASARVRTNIVAKLPPNVYEWPALSERDKLPTLRLLLNELALLAEYQLA